MIKTIRRGIIATCSPPEEKSKARGHGREEGGALRVTRRLLRSRRGVPSLEFVLACGPLLVLAFGFIATSAVFNTWSNMQSSAQYAARMMSTGQVTQNNNGTISSSNSTSSMTCSSSISTSKVEYYACANLPGWASFTVSTAEDCTKPSVTVTLSANAATAAIADAGAFFSGKTITSSAI